MLSTLRKRSNHMSVNETNPIKYLEIRIGMLKEELEKNSSNGNDLILGKAIAELETVLTLLKRNRLLSMSPYGD